MQADFKNPFPFCELCATWHAEGEHLNEQSNSYYRKKGRLDFWYGWLWGACFGLFVGLVAQLLEYALR